MSTDIEWVCDDCGQTFWGPAEAESADDFPCPHCQAADTVEIPNTALAVASPNEADFANELRYWVNEAHTDYPVYEPTFWEWITGRGDDALNQEQHRKWAAGQTVKQILKREKTMIRGFADAQLARMQAQSEVMRWQNYLLELHLYQQRLLEQAHLLHEEQSRIVSQEAVVEGVVVSEPEGETDADPEINFVMDRQRKKAREKAMAEQAVISEFLNNVRRVFKNKKLEPGERAMRIRSFMDSFGKGPEDLPAVVRKFLDEMEGTGNQ